MSGVRSEGVILTEGQLCMYVRKYILIFKKINWSPALRNLVLLIQLIRINSITNTKHRSWLLYNCTKVIDTPVQSPDINPIEKLWVHLKKKVRKRSLTNKNEWIRFIKEDWWGKKCHQNMTIRSLFNSWENISGNWHSLWTPKILAL